jgi:mannose-1-phosphate guanylyltransferase
MRALLLAAGIGSRLRPVTDSIPKCLVKVNNLTMLEYWVAKLDIPEVNQVVVNVHHFSEMVLNVIEKLNETGFITPILELELLGTAGTLLANIDECDDNLLVVHCDNFSSIDIPSLIKFHKENNNLLTLGVFEPHDPTACGMVSILPSGMIDEFVEKPPKSELRWGNAAVYIFSREALMEIKSKHNEAFDIAKDILPTFTTRMSAFKINGYHIDIGTIKGLKNAQDIHENY